MRIIVMIMLLGTSTACVAHSSHNHRNNNNIRPEANQWIWVEGHISHGRWVKHHWVHRTYGISYQAHAHGPPQIPARARANDIWVPGHHIARGNRRHWVPGRWHSPRRR
ncbi:MAG: hypothetical protein H8E12_08000 [Rhodobacteraceae bacterium]|nr:hypothetical protein [Paracoccaceae bacterium]